MSDAARDPRFRLPGRWISLDPRDEDATRAYIAQIARELIGAADDAVLMRRRVESGLGDAAATARAAEARLLLLCREVAPGVPTPVSITVHTPLTITPAIGTSPENVMRAFEQSLPHTSEPDLETATRLTIADSIVLRLHSVAPQLIEEGDHAVTQNRLAARYWYTVPGSKQVVLVDMVTPLGDIPHAMLRFFDSIVAASHWGAADAPSDAVGAHG